MTFFKFLIKISGVRIIFGITLFFANGNICSAQWTTKTSIPANIAQHGLVSHPNGNIYLFNGYNGISSFSFSNIFYIYNTLTNIWTMGPNVPYAARGVGYCLGSDNNIYCIAGASGSVTNSFVRFNPSTNTWSVLALCPNGSFEGALASYNNKVYYSGGELNETSLRIYDISSNTWTTGTSLPTGVMMHKMVSTNNGFLYVFGGWSLNNGPISVVQRYNIASNTWSTVSAMPTQKNSYGACLGSDGRIYIICGKNAYVNGSGPFYSNVNIYDPVLNTWSTGTSHPTAHGELAAVSSNCGIFAIGGTSGSGLSINYFLPLSSLTNVSLTPSIGICVNQNATLTASGALTYTWNTGSNSTSIIITPTAATIYSYSIFGTNSVGCTSANLFTVSATPLPTISLSSNTSICAGETFTINPAGASTFTISGGTSIVSPSVSTIYSISGTAAGCVSANSATILLTVNPLPTLAITGNNSICLGSTVTQFVNGSALTYTWSNGFIGNMISLSPSVTTIYTVIGTDANNCKNSSSKTIIVNSLPSLVVTSSSSLICEGETATINIIGANNYTWSNGSNNSYIIVNPTLTTTYSVSGTNLNGCDNVVTITQNVDACTGFSKSLNPNSRFKIFPNPSGGKLTIETDFLNGSETIEISNSLCQRVYFSILDSKSFELNICDQTNGVYFVRIYKNGEMTITEKIIKM